MQAIHAALLAAMDDISRKGIMKTLQAQFGAGPKVNYRGIESAMNEMSGVLIRNKLHVEAEYQDLHVVDRARGDPADGKFTRLVTLKGSFKFVAVEDGSSVTFVAYGEAADSQDKAVTKAQSVAFRTALFQQFVVPFMAIDPESDAGGDAGDDEFQPIYNGIESQETDEAALAYWKKHIALFGRDEGAKAKFRRMIEARRKVLRGEA